MKKIFYILLTFAFIIFGVLMIGKNQSALVTSSKISGYAQVHFNNVYLYRYPSEQDTFENKYFLLEPSYFVKLLEKTNDYFYKVEYNGITGYVLISEVEEIDDTPLCPYPKDITFSINSRNNALLRSEPTTEKQSLSILKLLPSGTDNIEYLGKISGEESLYGGGNIWYYCKVTTENQSFYGYVYANLTTNLTQITQNEEQVDYVSGLPTSNILYISNSSQNIIILLLLLPSLVMIYLFVKPSLISKKENSKIINKENWY